MFDPVFGQLTASTIAAAQVLAVANIDSPGTELNARLGVTNGALVICTQNIAGANAWTIYAFDSSSVAAVNSPYVVAAFTGGQWIAVAGKYVNSALSAASLTAISLTSGRVTFATTGGLLTDSANLAWNGTTLAVTGAGTFSTTLGVTGVSTLTGGFAAGAMSTVTGGSAPGAQGSTAVAIGAGTVRAGLTIICDATSGAMLQAQAAGTSEKYHRVSNNGVDFFSGIESSAAGGFFTGSAAYDAVGGWTAGRLFLRGALGVAINGAATMSSTLAVTGVASFTNTTAATSTTTGALVVSGGVGISARVAANGMSIGAGAGSSYIFDIGSSVAADIVGRIRNTSTAGYGFFIQNGTDANYALAIQNAAGSSNTIQLYGDGHAVFAGTLVVSSTDDVSAFGTAAVAIAGGLSVAKSAWVQDRLKVNRTDNTAAAVRFSIDLTRGTGSTATAAAITTTGDGSNGVTSVGLAFDNASVNTYTFSRTEATLAATTDSTSITTGALVVSGGIGVAKRLTLDGATGKTLRIVNGVANAAVATTMGAVGPTGSTAGNPLGWVRIDVAGTDRFIPYW